MDPYQSPASESEATPDLPPIERGAPCRACGSLNTTKDKLLRPRVNIFTVILFGWVVLLLRAAFYIRTSECRDCGEKRRYKTTGSQLALGFVIFLMVMIALAILEEYS